MERFVGNKKEYFIGDLSHMVNMSRDTLRFYEKKGIISAKRKENGYRYFSEDDLYRLLAISYHRKTDDSLENIRNFLDGSNSVSCLQTHLDSRIAEEEEELRRHRQIITRLKLMKRDMNAIENHLDRCCIKPFPSSYIIGSCKSLQESLQQWFQLSSAIAGMDMAYFYSIFSCQNNTLSCKEIQLLLYKQVWEAIQEGSDTTSYPSSSSPQCVYTVVKAEKPFPSLSLISKMKQWAHLHGIQTDSIVYSNNMTFHFDKEKNIYYLELYMPVTEFI